MKIGLTFDEVLEGTYFLLSDPLHPRPMLLEACVNVANVTDLVTESNAHLSGFFYAEGLAPRQMVSGQVGTRAVRDRKVPYDFTFKSESGDTLRFLGEKDLHVSLGLGALFHLPASVYTVDGTELARSDLHFDPRTRLERLLTSTRLHVDTRLPFVGRSPGADPAARPSR